jgi:Flp pilus assembly pilin Flp
MYFQGRINDSAENCVLSERHEFRRGWQMLTLLSLKLWCANEDGASAVEYSIVSGSMAVAIAAAMPFITNGTDGIYGYIAGLFDF